MPAAALPTAESPDYVLESDTKEDPEEDDDEDPEEDPIDYPADGGDDDDESSRDDEDDDDVDIEADDDNEEEEHPDPADSTTVALSAADQAPSANKTEPFKTDEFAATPPPHPAYRVITRISIPALVPTLIIVPVSDSSQHCAVCGTPVDGPYCHGCTRIRMKFEKDLLAYCVDNGVFQNFQDTPESSNDNTNVVNAPREPSVVDQDPGVNISQDPPQIDHNCCYECGDSLNGIFCQKCICEFCGKGAHFGYNCPPKDPIISELEPCYNQNFDCFPHDSQTLPQQYFCCENCGGPHETYQYSSGSKYGNATCSNGSYRIYAKLLDEVELHTINEKSIQVMLAEEKFLKIKQVVEEEQFQPEYLQELLQSLLTDLQILNEIQPFKQETFNQIQKDQEEKSVVERFQKANQALNESQSPHQ
ncbi:hypothetical protein Tco_0633967 [Tanacetum coccineum]